MRPGNSAAVGIAGGNVQEAVGPNRHIAEATVNAARQIAGEPAFDTRDLVLLVIFELQAEQGLRPQGGNIKIPAVERHPGGRYGPPLPAGDRIFVLGQIRRSDGLGPAVVAPLANDVDLIPMSDAPLAGRSMLGVEHRSRVCGRGRRT